MTTLRSGEWVMRCEARTLDDIRAMGGNSPEDERRFETAKRVSEMNLDAYRKFVQPWVKSMVTPQMAELMRNWHPLRLQYEAFSSQNPVHEGGGERGRQGARRTQAGRRGQSVPRIPGADVEADRQLARSMARLAGGAQRGDVPCDLWIAGAAGRGRRRSAVRRRRAGAKWTRSTGNSCRPALRS